MAGIKKEYIYIAIAIIVLIILFVFIQQKSSNNEVFTEKEKNSIEEINALGGEIDSLGGSVAELDDEIDITL